MSVIIKGMEMPGDCAECILRSVDCKYRKYLNFRPKECPLAEIPEKHGRLIDADIAYDKIAEQEGGYYLDMDGVDMGLQETPIILEAEG